MAPALNTIPQAPADEAALLTKPSSTKTSLKGLVAGAAVASFVLGLMAATAVTSAAPRAPAAFHSHKTFELRDDDGRCLTATSITAGSRSRVKSEYCDGNKNQMWEQSGSSLRLAGTSYCLDALGGTKAFNDAHKYWGVWKCDGGKNQKLTFDDDKIYVVGSDAFDWLDNQDYHGCLNKNGGAEISEYDDDNEKCDSWYKSSDGPTPAPPPTPRPVGHKCGDFCLSDRDCDFYGSDGSACTKCIKASGQENVCGHAKPAPAPTPSPAGKGKCDINRPPKEQGAKSCNSKYNDADGYNPECSDNGRCQVCRKSTTSKRFHGNNWHNFCMDPIDE